MRAVRSVLSDLRSGDAALVTGVDGHDDTNEVNIPVQQPPRSKKCKRTAVRKRDSLEFMDVSDDEKPMFMQKPAFHVPTSSFDFVYRLDALVPLLEGLAVGK